MKLLHLVPAFIAKHSGRFVFFSLAALTFASPVFYSITQMDFPRFFSTLGTVALTLCLFMICHPASKQVLGASLPTTLKQRCRCLIMLWCIEIIFFTLSMHLCVLSNAPWQPILLSTSLPLSFCFLSLLMIMIGGYFYKAFPPHLACSLLTHKNVYIDALFKRIIFVLFTGCSMGGFVVFITTSLHTIDLVILSHFMNPYITQFYTGILVSLMVTYGLNYLYETRFATTNRLSLGTLLAIGCTGVFATYMLASVIMMLAIISTRILPAGINTFGEAFLLPVHPYYLGAILLIMPVVACYMVKTLRGISIRFALLAAISLPLGYIALPAMVKLHIQYWVMTTPFLLSFFTVALGCLLLAKEHSNRFFICGPLPIDKHQPLVTSTQLRRAFLPLAILLTTIYLLHIFGKHAFIDMYIDKAIGAMMLACTVCFFSFYVHFFVRKTTQHHLAN